MNYPHSMEEHVAASAVAALAVNGKRGRDDAQVGGLPKMARTMMPLQAMVQLGPALPPAPQHNMDTNSDAAVKSFPYFFYRDFSSLPDPDPLTPLTSPGRVPNFPAKMHSILSRPDLADVVAWMPHGRSWRVLKPREFEIRVIPTYFEHAKFSSFIRQANGWGFRRITQGRDRNSYYHELFLRGLPHLCKQMKRPGVSEKQSADPEHEPDFYKIAEEHPVPEKADDESILLQCTLQGGPKARMPIYYGAFTSNKDAHAAIPSPVIPTAQTSLKQVAAPTNYNQFGAPSVTANDHLALNSFQRSISASENQVCNVNFQQMEIDSSQPPQPSMLQPAFMNMSAPLNMNTYARQQAPQAPPAVETPAPPLAAANHLGMPPAPDAAAAAYQASSAASQFAAGFAAATALSHQQFRSILGQALAAAGQVPGHPQMAAAAQLPQQPQQHLHFPSHN
jgi:hypothetical protein